MRVPFTVAAALFCLALGACGNRAEQAPPAKEGRAETQSIRNTEAIGYDGAAIADKVDAALDASEARKQQLDAELDAHTAAP